MSFVVINTFHYIQDLSSMTGSRDRNIQGPQKMKQHFNMFYKS